MRRCAVSDARAQRVRQPQLRQAYLPLSSTILAPLRPCPCARPRDSHRFCTAIITTVTSITSAGADPAAEHDEILGEMSEGVGNLKDHANNMFGEMTLQTKLLDEMDSDVDGAQQGLMAETNRATAVRKASGNCRLYLCIIFLLIVLIALLVVG